MDSLVSERQLKLSGMRRREMDGWISADAVSVAGDDHLALFHGVTYARSLRPIERVSPKRQGPRARSLRRRCARLLPRDVSFCCQLRPQAVGSFLAGGTHQCPFVLAAIMAATLTLDYVAPWTPMDVGSPLTCGNVWTKTSPDTHRTFF